MSLVFLTATPRWINLGSDLAFLNGAAGGTLAAWINTTRITGVAQRVVSVSIGPPPGASNSTRMGLIIDTSSIACIGRDLDANSPTTVTSGAVISANVWTHVAATYVNSSRLCTLYKDGVSVASGTWTNSSSVNFSATNCKNASIGAGSQGIDSFFDGQLADVRIYAVTLTADEIKSLWAMRSHDGIRRAGGGAAGALQLMYPLNDLATGTVGSTTNLRDVSASKIAPTPFAVTGSPVFSGSVLAPTRFQT